MKSLHALLLAALLPALLLPEGITLCLKRLVGEAVRTTCGASCCTHATNATTSPSFTSDESAPCCVTTPATGRALDPTTRKLDQDLLAAVTIVACTPSFAFPSVPPLATDLAARCRNALHPPRVVPISLPLRL